jgi:hypothetical protein
MTHMRWLVLMLISVMGSVSANIGTESTGLPSGYYGEWRGVGTQTDGSHWPIVIFLQRSSGGIVDYPTLSCSGQLQLQQRTAAGFRFREQLNHGNQFCINMGEVILRLTGETEMHYEWRDTHGEISAVATLRRSPSQRVSNDHLHS